MVKINDLVNCLEKLSKEFSDEVIVDGFINIVSYSKASEVKITTEINISEFISQKEIDDLLGISSGKHIKK